MCADVFVCVHTLSTGAVSLLEGIPAKLQNVSMETSLSSPRASAVWNTSSERRAGADEALLRTQHAIFEGSAPSSGLLIRQWHLTDEGIPWFCSMQPSACTSANRHATSGGVTTPIVPLNAGLYSDLRYGQLQILISPEC